MNRQTVKKASPHRGEIVKVNDEGIYIEVTQMVTGVKRQRNDMCSSVEVKFAITPRGDFINDLSTVKRHVKDHGITYFEKVSKDSSVCAIGYNPYEEMWYGWNHTAICGFKQPQAKKKAKRFAQSGI